MKKRNIFFIAILLVICCSCNLNQIVNNGPTGDPVKDGETFKSLLNSGKIDEANSFADECLDYYMQNYSGPEAKQKIDELGRRL